MNNAAKDARAAPFEPPWTRLSREQLARSLRESPPEALDLALMHWLVWLPLLSARELTGLVRGCTLSEQTVRAHLLALERLGWLSSVTLRHPGWSELRRYHLSDLGLYGIAALHPAPISLPRLVACYPVSRLDLVERLSRPLVHLVLSRLVSALASPGALANYRLSSYQQPYRQRFPDRRDPSRFHRWTLDAALLLSAPDDTARYAFYVAVDQPEAMRAEEEVLEWLACGLDVEVSMRRAGEAMPRLLLLAPAFRFPFWADSLLQVARTQSSQRLLPGAIADPMRLSDAAAPIWLPFDRLVGAGGSSHERGTSLVTLCTTPASDALAEVFAQTLSMQQVLLRRGTPAALPTRLSRYVGDSLMEEARSLLGELRGPDRRAARADLLAALSADKTERLATVALLNLSLSPLQQEHLVALLRHPHLSLDDLLTLHAPASRELRHARAALDTLCFDLGLVRARHWEAGANLREQERYALTEAGLRFQAIRHGLPSSLAYLYKVRRREAPPEEPPFLAQRGAWYLWQQGAHTFGLYRCVREALRLGVERGAYRVLDWKNSLEARLCYPHPQEQRSIFIYPDAELVYHVTGEAQPRSLLIEYDRGTMDEGNYQEKLARYAGYLAYARGVLPPILFVLETPGAAALIRAAKSTAGASEVPVVCITVQDLLKRGLPIARGQSTWPGGDAVG